MLCGSVSDRGDKKLCCTASTKPLNSFGPGEALISLRLMMIVHTTFCSLFFPGRWCE